MKNKSPRNSHRKRVRSVKRARGTRVAMNDRRGFTLIELLVVVLIISILAAIAQPPMTHAITKARAVEANSDMQVIRLAVYNYQTDQQSWPTDAAAGIVPPGLDAYLPAGLDFVKEDYTLDFDNWGGSPFMVGVTLIVPDATLGGLGLRYTVQPKMDLREPIHLGDRVGIRLPNVRQPLVGIQDLHPERVERHRHEPVRTHGHECGDRRARVEL